MNFPKAFKLSSQRLFNIIVEMTNIHFLLLALVVTMAIKLRGHLSLNSLMLKCMHKNVMLSLQTKRCH